MNAWSILLNITILDEGRSQMTDDRGEMARDKAKARLGPSRFSLLSSKRLVEWSGLFVRYQPLENQLNSIFTFAN
jgi:hypothetical protein